MRIERSSCLQSQPAKKTKTKILLLEDNPAHSELISRAFESCTDLVCLEVASSLRTARALLNDFDPDLAIADLLLPDGKGVELLRFSQYKGQFPVVIMTSHGDEEAAVEAIKAGALHYVVKSADTLSSMPQIAKGALREWCQVLERKRTESALQDSEKRYRTLYDDNPSMFFTINSDGVIISVNRFAAEQLGWQREDLINVPFADLCFESSRENLLSHLNSCFGEPEQIHRWETCQRHSSGERIWVRATARTMRNDQGEQTVLMVCEDITEARRLSKKLSFQASHDPLTSLFNRREFESRLAQALEEAQREAREHALCYLDLDQFKVINDTCGHIAGDMLLRQLGCLLHSRVRKCDTLARLGGDEFGVLIKDCSPENATEVAESLRRVITDFRFVWEDKTFTIGVSIGLVNIGEDSSSITSLLAAADSACYAAKDRGRNRIQIYHDEDSELVRRRGEMRWVSRISRALEEDRFRLNFQPIIPVACGNSGGDHYEVLIRMIDEDDNVISPGAFLPAAERYNLIGKLDHWVVGTTFDWLSSHPKHLESLHMCSINLSGYSLGSQDFLDFIGESFKENPISPDKICFEITETMAIANLPRAIRFIQSLKNLGCKFALDDFGSGLSSFAYLKNLPVDYLKIDGVFVRDMTSDPIDMAVVSSINEIGHVMGKETIAEFVQDKATFDRLREIGVDYVQGYQVGQPQPLSQLLS